MARFRLSALSLSRNSAALGGLALLAAASACDGRLVNLGASQPITAAGAAGAASSDPAANGGAAHGPHFVLQPTSAFVPQVSGMLDANATLTENVDELYFTRQPRSGSDLESHIQRMRLLGSSWSEPAPIAFVASAAADPSSPAISPDGQELWFGSSSPGGLGGTDIWHSVRQGEAWAAPENVGAPLCSASDDIPRPPALGGTLMPFSSKRHGAGAPARYQIYFAFRDAQARAWQEVTQRHLDTINAEAFESVDGFLTEDALSLYFSSTRNGDADLFVATRASIDDDFDEPTPIDSLNEQSSLAVIEQRDPWLSPDGQRLYFTSNRSGQYAVYQAELAP
jgi:hypothetical protein